MTRGRGSFRSLAARACLTALLMLGPPAAWAQAQDPPQTAPASDEPDSAEPERSADPESSTELEAVEPPTGVEEIVVVGEIRTAPSLKDTESVVLFDAADIQALGAADISDLSAYTPNVEIPTAGSTVPTFFIRGVGLADYNANSTGAISIYRDGVSINSAPIQLGLLFDLEQVQILRGPQGMGPYRNASGGSINVISKRPTGDYSAALTSTFGRFDERDFQGHVEAPIVEDLLAGRLAFRFRERDGYMKNGCATEPPGGRQPVVGRGTVAERKASVCGERMDRAWVPLNQVSKLPFGLEQHLNDTGTWAARGQLLFTPEFDSFDSQQWLLNIHGSHVDELSTVGTSYGTDGGYLGGTSARGYQEASVTALNSRIAAEFDAANPGVGGVPRREEIQRRVAHELANNLDPDPYRIDVDRTGDTVLDNTGGFLEAKLGRGDLQMLSRTGFEWYRRSRDADQDYTPIVIFETLSQDDAFQVTQDLNFGGELLDNNLSWNLGGFLLYEELDADIRNLIVETGNPTVHRIYSQKTTTFAAYGDLELRLSDAWTLEGGARFNQESKDFSFSLFNEGPDGRELGGSRLVRSPDAVWRAPTGMLSLSYHFSERSSLYWKYTRGWKAGHFNASANRLSPPTPPGKAFDFNADPETIDSFESGVKLRLLEDRLSIDAALFYYKYKDYQLLLTRQDADATLPNLDFVNADGAKTLGAEASVDAFPLKDWIPDLVDDLHLNVNFGWIDGKFTDFGQTTIRVVGNPQNPGTLIEILIVRDYTGNRLPYAAPFSLSISADWPIELGRFGTLTPRYDTAWTDTVYFDQNEGHGTGDLFGKLFLPDNTIGQRPYWVHNFRLAYQTPDGQFELAGWVRNFLDETYKINAFDGTTGLSSVIALLGEPRSYGLDFTVRW